MTAPLVEDTATEGKNEPISEHVALVLLPLSLLQSSLKHAPSDLYSCK